MAPQNTNKEKVIIVVGATGSGKSKLSIDLATHLASEIVNSDKIQVYKGLDILTNKVNAEECRGIPHHLLGITEPDEDFTAADFCRHVNLAVGSITEKGKVPIIAGGSNSFIEELVRNDSYFNSRYECCFLWIDVALPVLETFVYERVDQMFESGLVEEVRNIFEPESDYSKGIRRAIGVPELDQFFRAERSNPGDVEALDRLLKEGIEEIKRNTYELACKQWEKIQRLRDVCGYELHHINATEAFARRGKEDAASTWDRVVVHPSLKIVERFLNGVEAKLAAEEHMIGRATPRQLGLGISVACSTNPNY